MFLINIRPKQSIHDGVPITWQNVLGSVGRESILFC